DGLVACRGNESSELHIGNGVRVHPEAGHCDGVNGPFFWIELVGAHAKRATPDPPHASGWRLIHLIAVPSGMIEHRKPDRQPFSIAYQIEASAAVEAFTHLASRTLYLSTRWRP